jgi:hypothetical protein
MDLTDKNDNPVQWKIIPSNTEEVTNLPPNAGRRDIARP